MYFPLITDANKKYGNNRWLAYSEKVKRTVYMFSDLEYEHWLLVEFDENIVDFCEQPLKMALETTAGNYSSIIDMWIKYRDGMEEFREIKYTKDLEKEKVKRQINIQKQWCDTNGKHYKIMTENEIKNNTIKLSNIKIILRILKNTDIEETRAKDILNNISSERITINNLSEKTNVLYTEILAYICYLISINKIHSDYNKKPLGKGTEVWI